MNKKTEIIEFLKEIRNALPIDAANIDKIMVERGVESDEELEYLWVEALAEVTNTSIRNRNQNDLEEQLGFFSKQLDGDSDAVKNCIEVSFVENLMWNLDEDDKKWAWPKIPENLKSLYITMWGSPNF